MNKSVETAILAGMTVFILSVIFIGILWEIGKVIAVWKWIFG